MSIKTVFAKIYAWVRGLLVRSGLEEWLSQNWKAGLTIFIEEAKKHQGAPVHEWKQIVWDAIRRWVGPNASDNWVTLLVDLLVEHGKATKII